MPSSLASPATSSRLAEVTGPADVLALWPEDKDAWKDNPPVAIARVRTGREGWLEDFCEAISIPTLTVRYSTVRYYTRGNGARIRDVAVRPLFLGTVFVGGGDAGRDAYSLFRKRFGWEVAYTRQDVSTSQQPRLMADLLKVARIVAADLVPGDARCIRPGVRCRVIRGTFMGIEGTIVSEKSGGRFVIPIEILGTVCPTEIPIEDLELI
jgi:hypothetical protein